MMTNMLSQGEIENIILTFATEKKFVEVQPVLQVTEIRAVNATAQNEASKRYRVLLSDGVHFQQGMLATQRNELVSSNKLQKGSVIKVTQFICHIIQQRPIIIVVDLVILHETHDQIGQPTAYILPANVLQAHITQSTSENAQSANSHSSGGGLITNSATVGVRPFQPPKLERSPEIQSYTNNSFTTSAPVSHPGSGPRNYVPTSIGGSYGSQRGGFSSNNPEVTRTLVNPHSQGFRSNNNQEVIRTPVNSHPHQPMYQQPQSMYVNRGPIAKNEAPPRIIPIAALNPFQGRWTIKARVTSKSELRRFSNARGDGKVFSFDLLDSDGGEIRVTCFNTVVDQFFDLIEVGKVYIISKGSLKPARKDFNHLKNEHEIFLDATSLVKQCPEDDASIPRQQFHFCPVSDVERMDNGSIVDIIGVVTSVSPSLTIMRKNNTETQKRSLQLKDMSGKSVELVLWGNTCNSEGQELQSMCDSGRSPILAVKAARVNDFNGKALGTLSSSQLFVEPDFPETRALKQWFDQEGKNTPSVSISRAATSFTRTDVRKVIAQIKDEKLGTSDKPDYITVCASISFVKTENFCYTACPIMIGDRKCSKKVTNNGDGKWRCEQCDQSVDECDYRYILQCRILDHSGEMWVTVFQESAEEILGISAKELYYVKYEEQDDEKFSEIIREHACFNKYVLKLKVKEEVYSDERRIRSNVVKADRVNYSSESRALFDLISQLKADYSSTNIPGKLDIPTAQAGASSVSSGLRESEVLGPSAQKVGPYGNLYTGPKFGGSSGDGNGMYTTCSSCGGSGHNAGNCPSIMSGPGQFTSSYPVRTSTGPATGGGGAGGGSGECYKCHQPGHWARDCPGPSSVASARGAGKMTSGRYMGFQQQHLGGY